METPTDRGSLPQDNGGIALATLPTSRREILLHLKRNGESRAEDLAAALGITVSGVRQHLTAMAAVGLVRHREKKSGPGRPRFTYALTPAAEAFFPRAYAELANDILVAIEEEDPTLVVRLFDRRLATRIEHARRALHGDLAARVRQVAAILDSEGYLATVEQPAAGEFRLVEHNCAIPAIASRFPPVCAGELEFLRAVLPDATIERVSHLLAGDYVCAYEIRERPAAPTAF
ncbi:MAG TPA: helix-turn-helix domain-containing protein [Tepidiformaceae bacterium]|nr:helix-turn-helix domain-containing protein [Tepidiformaceae bacterium]